MGAAVVTVTQAAQTSRLLGDTVTIVLGLLALPLLLSLQMYLHFNLSLTATFQAGWIVWSDHMAC